MKKKIALFAIIILSSIFIVTYSFADNDMLGDATNGIRNFVGGTENVIEDAAGGVRNFFTDNQNTTENVTYNNNNSDNIAYSNYTSSAMTQNTNNNYTATRTAATTSADNSLFGMGPTAWTLFILAVLGIITVGLVWYYGTQKESRYSNRNDNNY